MKRRDRGVRSVIQIMLILLLAAAGVVSGCSRKVDGTIYLSGASMMKLTVDSDAKMKELAALNKDGKRLVENQDWKDKQETEVLDGLIQGMQEEDTETIYIDVLSEDKKWTDAEIKKLEEYFVSAAYASEIPVSVRRVTDLDSSEKAKMFSGEDGMSGSDVSETIGKEEKAEESSSEDGSGAEVSEAESSETETTGTETSEGETTGVDTSRGKTSGVETSEGETSRTEPETTTAVSPTKAPAALTTTTAPEPAKATTAPPETSSQAPEAAAPETEAEAEPETEPETSPETSEEAPQETSPETSLPETEGTTMDPAAAYRHTKPTEEEVPFGPGW